MPLSRFHPIIAEWFRDRFDSPTDVQVQSWPAITSGENVLIAAPTGSGKTLAAFLSCLDDLLKGALAGGLEDRTQVLYVSPLKALSNDVQKNLQQPLIEISDRAETAGLPRPEIRVMVRTGDTPGSARQQMVRRPPHILITTPESLYLLLTADKSRQILRDVRTVIVDEIHAVAPNKRGAHLSLSLERLDALTRIRPVRIGLSATQRPIEAIAQFLSPPAMENPSGCRIVDIGHRRAMDLAVEVPKDELGAVATNAIWSDIYDRVADLVRAHRSTLVFVNTRRLAERVAHHLEERLSDLGAEVVAAHHGSLSRQIRLTAEERLKQGQTRVVVATASLELGIDVGTVDLVCQIGSPRAIATCLQRVGRSGHWIGAQAKGRLFATTRDELLECAALVRAIRRGLLDHIEVPPAPLDILAQQIVAEVSAQEWQEDALFALCRRAYPYRNLDQGDFSDVLRMLADGITTRRGRSSAYLHHDRIHRRLRARRGARLAALTGGGAIPDTFTYAVIAEPDGTQVGTVDEDFAVESLAGDIILLGNSSWRIRGVETGKVRVEDAHGAPPTIPFWRGEAPSRTAELSAEVGALREEIDRRLTTSNDAIQYLQAECGLERRGAEQAAAYVAAGRQILGTVPTHDRIIAERFFDEGGGMQLVLHAPFGGRINRAWGLALRKRFCATFDQELQAAATDEGLVLSLSELHSFPLEAVFGFLRADTVRDVLLQAILASPMFTSRWRWNATRALALLRFMHGRRVPPQIQRMRAEDLLAAVFPAALACQDNLRGAPEETALPDHPLINETVRDCLTEAMDVEGLMAVLGRIERGDIRCRAVDTPLPSAFCHEILNANPYAYLDDAPLEERRARAVEMRRSLSPELAGDLGALDPAAMAEVQKEAWPVVRDADELHDALLTLIWVPEELTSAWTAFLSPLIEAGRAVVLSSPRRGWIATERTKLVRTVFPDAQYPATATDMNSEELPEREDAIRRIVQGWMESTGPTTAEELAGKLHLPTEDVHGALLRLEADGQVLRGNFKKNVHEIEWCHRRLLARIHRLTIGRLRREIEPVTAADFMCFLFQWQHVAPGSRLHGEAGLLETIRLLAGYEAAASAWERYLLTARVSKYDPGLLDRLCLSGAVSWGRLSPPARATSENEPTSKRRVVPTSLSPISLFPREDAEWLLDRAGNGESSPPLSTLAEDVHRFIHTRGASFFADIVKGTGHLPAEVEQSLWELVAAGSVTADGFDNLRALLDPRRRRAEGRERSRRPRHAPGRWSLLGAGPPSVDAAPTTDIEPVARQLLRRYGVVFRDLLQREALPLAWRDLLMCYRKMELRGLVRGGRFVGGFIGEQFALPEAVESLRALRRAGHAEQSSGQDIKVSAADPLNLVGIILPGTRVPAIPANYVVFRDGAPIRTGAVRDPDSRDRFPIEAGDAGKSYYWQREPTVTRRRRS